MEYQICLALIVTVEVIIFHRNIKMYQKGKDSVNPPFPLVGVIDKM